MIDLEVTPFFMSAHLRAGPFRTLKMRPVRQGLSTVCGVGCSAGLEDASRTRGGCFWHRISLPYRRSLFFTPNASENASRTPGSLFEHGTHIPYHRWPSPVPNARHRSKLPPQRSLADILVDLFTVMGVRGAADATLAVSREGNQSIAGEW